VGSQHDGTVFDTPKPSLLPVGNSHPLASRPLRAILYPALIKEEQDDEILTEDAPVIVSEEQAELDTLFGATTTLGRKLSNQTALRFSPARRYVF
jgi:hypothetical protein